MDANTCAKEIKTKKGKEEKKNGHTYIHKQVNMRKYIGSVNTS